MQVILSKGYSVVIENSSDTEISQYISGGNFNWDAFGIGDTVHIETSEGEYHYVVDYINFTTCVVVLV